MPIYLKSFIDGAADCYLFKSTWLLTKNTCLQPLRNQQENFCEKNRRFRIQDWWLTCNELGKQNEREKMLTLAFDFPVVAALEVSAAAAAAPLVFLLIILFGELLRCKNGLFCTVPPVLKVS